LANEPRQMDNAPALVAVGFIAVCERDSAVAGLCRPAKATRADGLVHPAGLLAGGVLAVGDDEGRAGDCSAVAAGRDTLLAVELDGVAELPLASVWRL